jgi:MinD-like ATPase involved in chromosome partitioning or flagellar assembly
MSQIICVHSFQRRAGKSSLVANLAALLALAGHRVGVVDADFHVPSMHKFYGLPDEDIPRTINDFMWGGCKIVDAVYDIPTFWDLPGKLVILPASSDAGDILQMLRTSYDFDRFSDGLYDLIEAYDLDFLLVDTTAGVNEETLLSIASADKLVVLLRPEKNDYQGTAVTLELARNLGVPHILLVLNEVPADLDFESARRELQETYQCDVAALLPYSKKYNSLAYQGVLALVDPEDPFVPLLKRLLERLVET